VSTDPKRFDRAAPANPDAVLRWFLNDPPVDDQAKVWWLEPGRWHVVGGGADRVIGLG